MTWDSVYLLERAIAIADREPYSWTRLAEQHGRLGNLVIGLQATDAALSLEPERSAAREVRTRLLANLGRYGEAAAAADEIFQRTSDPWAQAVKAWVLSRTGQLQEAATLFERILPTAPDAVWYRSELAFEWMQIGKWNAAARLYQWLLDHRRNRFSPEHREKYGWAALACGREDQAKQDFEACFDRTDEPYSAKLGLACVSFAFGHLDAGYHLFREAVDSVANMQQFDGFMGAIPLLERIHVGWPFGREAMTFVHDTGLPALQQRKGELEQPVTPLEEIDRVLARASEPTAVTPGAVATRARLLAEAGRTDEAAVLYESLLGAGMAPDGRNALARAYRVGAELAARDGRPGDACVLYRSAVRRETAIGNAGMATELHARLCMLHLFDFGDVAQAMAAVRDGLAALRDNERSDASGFAKRLTESVSDRGRFRRMAAVLRKVAGDLSVPEPERACARDVLFWFLRERYRSSELGDTAPTPWLSPVRRPVEVVLGPGLLADEQEQELIEGFGGLRARLKAHLGITLPGVRSIRADDPAKIGQVEVLVRELRRIQEPVDRGGSKDECQHQILGIVERALQTALPDLVTPADFDEFGYAEEVDATQCRRAPETSVLRTVVRSLLADGIPLVDRAAIRRTVMTPDAVEATAAARLQLTVAIRDAVSLRRAMIFDVASESALAELLSDDALHRPALVLSAHGAQELIETIRIHIAFSDESKWFLIVRDPRLRAPLRALLRTTFWGLLVVSRHEVADRERDAEELRLTTQLTVSTSVPRHHEVTLSFARALCLEQRIRAMEKEVTSLVGELLAGRSWRMADDDMDKIYARAYYEYDAARLGAARTIFAALVEGPGRHEAAYWRALGAVNQQMRDYSAAIEAYGHAVERDPADAILFVYRGESYLLAGDHERARGDLQRAVATSAPSGSDRASLLLERMDAGHGA